MRYPVFLVLLSAFAIISASHAQTSTIENEHLLFGFNDQGNLVSIFNKASRQDYYHGDGKSIIKVLHHAKNALAEVPMTFVSSTLLSVPDGRVLSLKFTGADITAIADIKVIDGNPKSVWNLTIENNGNLDVVEVVFPDLDRIQIGDDPKDDVLVRPNRDGQKIPNPSENLFHNAGDIVDGMIYGGHMNNPTLIYSGMAGMFWMDLYDPSGGLYIASEDKELIGGYLANSEDGRIGMSLGKYLHVAKGQKFTLQYAVGVHTGDWHWGADRYREWAETFFRKAEIARWVREMPSWYWRAMMWTMGMEKPKLDSPFTFNDLNGKLMDGSMRLGSDTVGLAGQEFMGHDFPFWFPDPSLGDENTIRTQTAELKRRGGHVVPYINPIYAWENYPNTPHSESPEFQERAQKVPSDVLKPNWDYYKNYVAQNYEGKYGLVEWHYYGNLPQMCMASKEWQDYVLWWTHKYATDYGFSGVQWDQLGAYQMAYCTNWSHGHQHGGIGPSGTVELCRRIYEDSEYKVDKEFYIWYEGGGDCMSQYLQSCHSGFDGWNAYTFPDMIRYTFQRNTYGGEWSPSGDVTGNAAIRKKRSVELSLLGRYKLGTGAGEHAEKIQKLTKITNAIKGIYWYTNFKDDLGCLAPEGMWIKGLEIDSKESPYISKDGYIIPYVDIRKNKSACEVKLDKKLYNLSGVTKVYWYPSQMQGLRKEIKFDNSKSDYLTVKFPANGQVNLFSYENAYCDADDTVSNIGAIVIAKQDLRHIKILGPGKVKHDSEVKFRTVEQKITGNESSVSALPGRISKENGLKVVEVYDGPARPTRKAGEECLQTSPKMPYIYLDVLDSSMTDKESVVEVKIRYFDEGKGTIRIQYNSTDMYAIPFGFDNPVNQEHKGSANIFKQDTKKWRTAVLLLPDALFQGKMSNGADLRICSYSGPDYISSVTVTKKKVKYSPIPDVTLCVGNDMQVTDKDGILKYRFGKNDPKGVYILDAYKDGPDGFMPVSSVIKID
ncbi:MAG: DUF6259 domain-containing protein [Armatimonadota bacterium]